MSVCQSPEVEMIGCPDNIPGCLVMHTRPKGTKPKEETITIKKALWDEMLEYKRKVDSLINDINKLEKRVTIDAQWVWKQVERIDKLETILLASTK